MILFKALLVLVYAGCALAILRLNRRAPPGAAGLVLLGGYAAADRFILRSSLFSDIFSCVLIVLLLALRRGGGSRRKRAAPAAGVILLFLVWGNTHSGYWPALGMIFCFFAGEAGEALIDRLRGRGGLRERLPRLALWVACGLGALAACFANPFTYKAVVFPFKIRKDAEELSRYFGEYRPTFSSANFATGWQLQAFLVLCSVMAVLAGAAALRALRRRAEEAGDGAECAVPRLPLAEVLTGALLIYASTLFVRFLSSAALGIALLSVHLLSRNTTPSRCRAAAGIGAAVEAALCLGAVILLATGGYASLSGHRSPGLGLDRDRQPEAAADYIEKHGLVHARLFNQHEAGAYLIWRFDGAMKVFYHGWMTDNDFYFAEYAAAAESAEEFRRIVQKYDVEGFLLSRPPPIDPRKLPPLYLSLYLDPQADPPRFAEPGRTPWRLVYWDNRYVLYLKDIPRFAPIIRRDAFLYADPVMTQLLVPALHNDPTRARAELSRALASYEGLRLPPVWRDALAR